MGVIDDIGFTLMFLDGKEGPTMEKQRSWALYTNA